MKISLAVLTFVLASSALHAQLLSQQKSYAHADTLRGSITPERAWWDLLHYDLHVQFHPKDSTISGYNVIQFKQVGPQQRMQIDLMQPLVLDSVVHEGKKRVFKRDGNVYYVTLPPVTIPTKVTAYYHGKPQIAKRPPWDGGLIWAKDRLGRPWISVACQGLGASVWYPCKDHQADEPDSTSIHIDAADSMIAVSNGKLKSKVVHEGKPYTTYTWVVKNPINNYNLIPYLGEYVELYEVYLGEKGQLPVSYWVINYNSTKASTHLRNAVLKTLKNLEYWFGPYPFYEDGFKMVESPHLGMEHQSAIAYGNKFQNGYLGRDLSGTGRGLTWDFIVVHESAHEWFGNNITSKDLADMWVHESFANYAETLYIDRESGTVAGDDYVIGCRQNIQNDVPIIGKYNVNEEGSGDMYYKGGTMLHMIRKIINDDEKFRSILRGLNKDFYHKTVTGAEVEAYISAKSGIDFSKVFDQYLRTTQIPLLKYHTGVQNGKPILVYVWTNCVIGFDMPVKVTLDHGREVWLKPLQSKYQTIEIGPGWKPENIVDRNFYVTNKFIIPADD